MANKGKEIGALGLDEVFEALKDCGSHEERTDLLLQVSPKARRALALYYDITRPATLGELVCDIAREWCAENDRMADEVDVEAEARQFALETVLRRLGPAACGVVSFNVVEADTTLMFLGNGGSEEGYVYHIVTISLAGHELRFLHVDMDGHGEDVHFLPAEGCNP